MFQPQTPNPKQQTPNNKQQTTNNKQQTTNNKQSKHFLLILQYATIFRFTQAHKRKRNG